MFCLNGFSRLSRHQGPPADQVQNELVGWGWGGWEGGSYYAMDYSLFFTVNVFLLSPLLWD